MKNSNIAWTDHTFNGWEGCTKCSPGCAHCYAETRNNRFNEGKNWGKGAPRRRTSIHNWNQPRKWNKEAGESALFETDKFGTLKRIRPRVFSASLSDWLDDEVPIEWLANLLQLIRECQNLDWLLLSKRPQNWRTRLLAARDYLTAIDAETAIWLNDWLNGTRFPANVWIGTTVENQEQADIRVPQVLEIPALIHFLSCEPLLEEVNIAAWLVTKFTDSMVLNGNAYQKSHHSRKVSWVICGGESGKGARPMHEKWARSLRDQCRFALVAFFHKQWGEYLTYPVDEHAVSVDSVFIDGKSHMEFHDWKDGNVAVLLGTKNTGRLLDGIEYSMFPIAGGAN